MHLFIWIGILVLTEKVGAAENNCFKIMNRAKRGDGMRIVK